MRKLLPALCLALLSTHALAAQAPSGHKVHTLKVVLLSTMLADAGIGEWGFSALVEADGQRLLFDTGARPDTVLQNSRELGIDLSTVREVVLSHNHDDHTGGLLTLRHEMMKKDPRALSRTHVGKGIFLSRTLERTGQEDNLMIKVRPAYQATGSTFVEHDRPVEIFPGVWLTGPVPRPYPEHNYGGARYLRAPTGPVLDTVPEDQSLVIDTDKGLVVLTGCGHAGIINTLDYARKLVRQAPIHAALGGFHLYNLGDKDLDWTAAKLREMGTQTVLGAHCTGIEAVYRIRDRAGLSRNTCVVGAVGAEFNVGQGAKDGINPLRLAR